MQKLHRILLYGEGGINLEPNSGPILKGMMYPLSQKPFMSKISEATPLLLGQIEPLWEKYPKNWQEFAV